GPLALTFHRRRRQQRLAPSAPPLNRATRISASGRTPQATGRLEVGVDRRLSPRDASQRGRQSGEARRAKQDGAVEKTRTSTGCPTPTSTRRVYQSRHDRIRGEARGLAKVMRIGKRPLPPVGRDSRCAASAGWASLKPGQTPSAKRFVACAHA